MATFNGKSGDDFIDRSLSGSGDVIDGKDGNDLLVGGAGADRLYGGDGIDAVSYATSSSGVILTNSMSSTPTPVAARAALVARSIAGSDISG